jgi:DNA-binding NarL/FixJ family response regulator
MIVDRDTTYRADLARYLVLADVPCTVVGGVGTAEEALTSAQHLSPDILLTDVDLPDASGLVLAQRLAELRPAMAVVVIGQHPDGAYQQAALAAGAFAYVDKLDLGRVLADVLVAASRESAERKACQLQQSAASHSMVRPTAGDAML